MILDRFPHDPCRTACVPASLYSLPQRRIIIYTQGTVVNAKLRPVLLICACGQNDRRTGFDLRFPCAKTLAASVRFFSPRCDDVQSIVDIPNEILSTSAATHEPSALMLFFFAKPVILLSTIILYLQPCLSLQLPSDSWNSATTSATPNATRPFANDTEAFIAPKCVRDPDWMGDGIMEFECRRLVNRFYSAILPTADRSYVFVAAESHSIAPPSAVRLPRKYVDGEPAVDSFTCCLQCC